MMEIVICLSCGAGRCSGIQCSLGMTACPWMRAVSLRHAVALSLASR